MKNPVCDLLVFIIFISSVSGAADRKIGSEYSYDLKIVASPVKWFAGECNSLEVRVRNTGKIPWVVLEDNIKWRVRLSYHIFDGEKLVTEGVRTDFEHTVRPGQTVSLKMNILLPPRPGTYRVVIDMLKEGKFWFKEIRNNPLIISVLAEDPLMHSTIAAEEWETRTFEGFLKKSKELGTGFRAYIPYPEVQAALKLIARNYEKNFADEKSSAAGWFPGCIYPQVWLRDSYYHSAAAGFLYPPEIIKKILEDFLEYSSIRQGYVPDYISTDGETANYTVASDRYPLLILLACEYINQSGDYEWLSKKTGKTTIYHQLNSIINKLYQKVFDENNGLYFSGHIADWGDVEFEDSGSDSQELGRSSHKVAGIYTQSLFYASLREWAGVLYKVHLYQPSMTNFHKADVLKIRTEAALWDKKAGFFKMHHHLDSLIHDFSEDSIFALGGNIWAVRSGLADSAQVEKILDKISYIKKINTFPTISKCLQPPYPKDFFKNPALSEPGRYQNGGFWDWYGGLAVLEEFRARRFEAALAHLREIASVAAANRNLYEWYDSTSRGQGSLHYLASGATVFESITKGYFGLEQKANIWHISPALDVKSRSVYFNRTDKGLLIAFRIEPLPAKRMIEVDYSLSGQDTFTFTLPIIRISKAEFEKRKGVYDKKLFFFDEKRSILLYRNILAEGKGVLKILY
jgi:hypothetical protein